MMLYGYCIICQIKEKFKEQIIIQPKVQNKKEDNHIEREDDKLIQVRGDVEVIYRLWTISCTWLYAYSIYACRSHAKFILVVNARNCYWHNIHYSCIRSSTCISMWPTLPSSRRNTMVQHAICIELNRHVWPMARQSQGQYALSWWQQKFKELKRK